MGKGFSLFRTWEPDAPELHTDPVVRGYGLDKLARLVRWFATPMLICALVILALPYGSFWPGMSRYCPWSPEAGTTFSLYPVRVDRHLYVLPLLLLLLRPSAAAAGRKGTPALRLAVFRPHQRRLSGRLLYLGGPQLCRPGSRAWHALGGETATVNRPFPDFALEELEGRPRLEAAPPSGRWSGGGGLGQLCPLRLVCPGPGTV